MPSKVSPQRQSQVSPHGTWLSPKQRQVGSMIVWWNGKLLPIEQVRLSPTDHGFLVGDGVFETLLAREGITFAVTRHWQRLANSCTAMSLTPPPLEMVRSAFKELLLANHLTEARLRLTLTSGAGPAGSERGLDSEQTLCITATPLNLWKPTERLHISPWPRLSAGALTGVKSVSYAENVRALALARSNGAGECLFANELGEVCEGTGSNIFIVRNGTLETPPLSSGCLAGVTRALVLELANQLSIPVTERSMPLSQLVEGDADEVFLTSTTRDVHPVERIGEREFTAPGPTTSQLRTAFLDWQKQQPDP
jgi:branched-chain amino acid aminotransferase